MPVLTFKGKTAVENHHHTIPHHVLELDAGRSVLAKGEKSSLDDNLIIEGDNLLALKALLPTHTGRIKCVYIDPPYNTGNEGWVYNDNLTQPQFKEWIGQVVGKEGEDATRHDKWCCMMLPRLRLLRELLKKDGAIFISIDDNEYACLRLLMDEIFGSDCFVASFVWQKRYSRENRSPVGTVHEYVLVYSRTVGSFGRIRHKLSPSEESRAVYRNPNNDPKGDWRPIPMTAQEGHATKDQFYKIKLPSGRMIDPPKGRCWSMIEETFKQLRTDKRIYFGADGDSQPNVIRYWTEVEGFVPWTWWPHEEVGHTDEAKKELFEFFEKDDVFDSPKPTRLVERILRIYSDVAAADIILDSFAGSGTTAHSVLRLNAEDGGNRRFILVQQQHDSKDDEKNQLNICDSITAERVRLVMRGYTRTKRNGESERKEKVDGLGGSFTYARLGPPLLGEHKTWGEKPPAYGDLAQYIFFTETSHRLDPKEVDETTGRLGEHAGTSYYLLYTPDPKQCRALDRKAADVLAKDKTKKKVVYCEKLWIHRDELPERVRPMILPFQVK